SKENDLSSGLIYFGHRFYDPNEQRWLNRDPSGLGADRNLYSYAYNNPVSAYDGFGDAAVFSWSPQVGYAKDGLTPASIIINITPDVKLDWSWDVNLPSRAPAISPDKLVKGAEQFWSKTLWTPYKIGGLPVYYNFQLKVTQNRIQTVPTDD